MLHKSNPLATCLLMALAVFSAIAMKRRETPTPARACHSQKSVLPPPNAWEELKRIKRITVEDDEYTGSFHQRIVEMVKCELQKEKLIKELSLVADKARARGNSLEAQRSCRVIEEVKASMDLEHWRIKFRIFLNCSRKTATFELWMEPADLLEVPSGRLTVSPMRVGIIRIDGTEETHPITWDQSLVAAAVIIQYHDDARTILCESIQYTSVVPLETHRNYPGAMPFSPLFENLKVRNY